MTKETKERFYVIVLVLFLVIAFNIVVMLGLSIELMTVCAINVLVGWNLDKICSYLRAKLFGG